MQVGFACNGLPCPVVYPYTGMPMTYSCCIPMPTMRGRVIPGYGYIVDRLTVFQNDTEDGWFTRGTACHEADSHLIDGQPF